MFVPEANIVARHSRMGTDGSSRGKMLGRVKQVDMVSEAYLGGRGLGRVVPGVGDTTLLGGVGCGIVEAPRRRSVAGVACAVVRVGGPWGRVVRRGRVQRRDTLVMVMVCSGRG